MLLPGAAALLVSAESAEAVARLRTVARWVRTGRALTVDGRLLLADARSLAGALGVDAFSRDHARTADDLPETSLLVAWARQARLLRVVKGRLVPVKSAAALLGRPIELWQRAFVAIGTLGEHFGGSNVFGAVAVRDVAGRGVADPAVRPLRGRADPVPLELFHRRVREAVNERFGCIVDDLAGDVEQRLWRRDVTAVLDALELLGAVHLSKSHDHDMLTELAGRDDPDPTLVALTPIGLWGVREMLLEQGVPAPLVGELAGEDVEYVCVRLAGARREVAEAELTAWVAARSPRMAADELARLLRRTERARAPGPGALRAALQRRRRTARESGTGRTARGGEVASDRPARRSGHGTRPAGEALGERCREPGHERRGNAPAIGDRCVGQVPTASSLLTMGWTAERRISR